MKNIYLFGNGDISLPNFIKHYCFLENLVGREDISFHIGDFLGCDVLLMELIKQHKYVTVYSKHSEPKYLPSIFNSEVSHWGLSLNYKSHSKRDIEMIKRSNYFVGVSFRPNSGTEKLIKKCLKIGLIEISKSNIHKLN